MTPEDRRRLIGIDMVPDGPGDRLADLLAATLRSAISDALLGSASPKTREGLGQAGSDLCQLVARFGASKLEKPTLENHRIQAEIAKLYSEALKNEAEAHKLFREAEAIDAQLKEDLVKLAVQRVAHLLAEFVQRGLTVTLTYSGDEPVLYVGGRLPVRGMSDSDPEEGQAALGD